MCSKAKTLDHYTLSHIQAWDYWRSRWFWCDNSGWSTCGEQERSGTVTSSISSTHKHTHTHKRKEGRNSTWTMITMMPLSCSQVTVHQLEGSITSARDLNHSPECSSWPTSLLVWLVCMVKVQQMQYSGFRLMGPPVKRVSRLIGSLCRKQTYNNVPTILCLIGSAA